MIRIGNSDIWWKRINDIGIIQVPVPPSTNERQTIGYKKITGHKAGFSYSKNRPILVKTKVARDYEGHIPFIKMALNFIGAEMITDYAVFNFYFTLKNPRYDTHNGLKIICDVLEKSALVSDDRFILPHIERPEFSTTLPNLKITFPLTA